MRKAAEYSSYKDLKPLFDEATSYYYTMNISGEGIEECVEQYAALTKKMSDIERDSGTFVAVVNGTNGYTALESITNKTKLYEALSTCYGCLENLDATYEGVAAAKVIYDVEKIMQAVVAVTQTLKEEQLVEIEKVKTDIELIFNGKLLNPEDLEFKNIKNAIFLIKKIGAKIDTKARAYLNRKMKEPLIKKRDEIKQDIATMKGDLDNTRDMLTALDVN